MDYSSFTVVILKNMLRERGLPVSGKKSVLIDRLSAASAPLAEKKIVYSSKKSECFVIDDWLPNPDAIFEKAQQLPLDERPKCIIYGKNCRMNRSVGFFSEVSDGYKYSNQIASVKKIPSWLKKLMDTVNSQLGTNFNGVLVNQYDGGGQSIGAHSDDEKGLSDGKVACISLGISRKFRIKNKKTGAKTDTVTQHGQLLVMQGDFQRECTHEIPREMRLSGRRISLTFRCHIE